MNVSAHYNMMPYMGTIQEREVRPEVYTPLPSVEEKGILSAGRNEQKMAEGTHTYKYYVISEDQDQIYTRQMQAESLLAGMKGALLNVYA